MPDAPLAEGWDSSGRLRAWRQRRVYHRLQRMPSFEFVNPYPWMSETAARIHLFLQSIEVPFSWKNFDAPDLAPHLVELMADYHPDFTLREYKFAIIVLGTYTASLPGALDRDSLAKVLLEQDGWTVAMLWDVDVRRSVQDAVLNALPALRSPAITGPPRANPYPVDLSHLQRMRANISALNLRRTQFLKYDRKVNPYGPDRKRRAPRLRNRRSRYRAAP